MGELASRRPSVDASPAHLTADHDERLNADYHNRIIRKRQYGYGRTARNLADRALGTGAFASPKPFVSRALAEVDRRVLASLNKKALTKALGELAPVFDHFGINVKRGKDGWVFKDREHGAIAISDSGTVAVSNATGRPEGRP